MSAAKNGPPLPWFAEWNQGFTERYWAPSETERRHLETTCPAPTLLGQSGRRVSQQLLL